MQNLDPIVRQINALLNLSDFLLFSEEENLSDTQKPYAILRECGVFWARDVYGRLFENESDMHKSANHARMRMLLKEAKIEAEQTENTSLKKLAEESDMLWNEYFAGFDDWAGTEERDPRALLRQISSLLDVVDDEAA